MSARRDFDFYFQKSMEVLYIPNLMHFSKFIHILIKKKKKLIEKENVKV